MLQNAEHSPLLSFKEPSFLALLSLQTLKTPWELESFYHNQTLTSSMEGFDSTVSSQEEPFNANTIPFSSPLHIGNRRSKFKSRHLPSSMTREWRKRRRRKSSKNLEEIENQRMTHIAVERNRRRQMNDHLNSLRFLMPPSYIQRGDQESIIGGAINLVKDLEQLLQSLEAQKLGKDLNSANKHLRGISSNTLCAINEEQIQIPKIEATVIQNHVNLKVQCKKKQGQLLKAIISLEELRLIVLHLNITSSYASMFFSFNLKIEEDCILGSAKEIETAMHRIFEQIHGRE